MNKSKNNFVLSPDQEAAMSSIEEWWGGESEQICLGGYAGTGKTTLINQIAFRLGLDGTEILYATPTNHAKSVLAEKLAAVKAPGSVNTLHSLLYGPPRTLHCSECPAWKSRVFVCHGENGRCGCAVVFNPKAASPVARVAVVDEASMISYQVYLDLMDKGIRVIFTGDHGQLPPVEQNPAYPNFSIMEKPDIRLEKIHRQKQRSEILNVAYCARNGKGIPFGVYGGINGDLVEKIRYKRIDAGLFRGIDREFFTKDGAFLVSEHRDRMKAIREMRRLLGRGPGPEVGDRVLCHDNLYGLNVSNGTKGTLTALGPRRLLKTVPAYAASIETDDGRLIETIISADQFDYVGLKTPLSASAQRFISRWSYGYAQTVHSAQGSQWRNVFVFDDVNMMLTKSGHYKRWLYTAVTRASESLIIAQAA